MTTVVCDASVLFKLLVDEPHNDRAKALVASAEVYVPELCYAELGNAVWAYMRRHRLNHREGEVLLDILSRAPLDVRSIRPHYRRALALASIMNHPLYDCIYLALAETLGLPLVTADRRLIAAVRRAPFSSLQVHALADFV